jgi:DNA invertase Pin-like site-specific DNA recombinase
MSGKLNRIHLERTAFVYVRQSTMKQVQEHRESQYNQYALVQRALTLGWVPHQVQVIDSDLGQSGQSSEGRLGFQELVAEVSLGRAGIVLGSEASRLARNGRDWHHLLEVCALWGTLIGDADGVYDPREYNDRLLLGLKGTMSEAELHLLRSRMDAGRMNQVRRGEYVQLLPTGYVRQPGGTVAQDPDQGVREALETVFTQFARLRSVPKLLRFFRDQSLLLPRHQPSGPRAGELLWKCPTASALLEILRNPAYAGAFAYGRKQMDPRLRKPGHPAAGRVRRPQEEWLALHRDAYPAYLSWEEYQANQRRLDDNATRYSQGHEGTPRKGAALLQGLVVCGQCGYHMHVAYRPQGHRYLCHTISRQLAGPSCGCFQGVEIDRAVVEAFFQALAPAQLDVLQGLLEEQGRTREQVARQWRLRLERCHYQERLAQRQYEAVDPENRLVAAELERRWEERLRELREAEGGLQQFQKEEQVGGLSPELRPQLEDLGRSLPSLWQRLSPQHQKALLRTMVQRVVIKRVVRDQVQVRVVWVSSHVSTLWVSPSIHRLEELSTYQEMMERVKELFLAEKGDIEIAMVLQEEGHRSARTQTITPGLVGKLRRRQGLVQPLHRLRRQATFGEGYWTVHGLAQELEVNRNWLYVRVRQGRLPTVRHPQSGNYLIPQNEQLLDPLRKERAVVKTSFR